MYKLTDRQVIVLKVLIHAVCLYYLADIYYRGFNDQLGGDPVSEIIHFTGLGVLNLLFLTLLVSPLVRYTKQPRLMRVRRLLGLYAFTYAVAHVFNYISFDLQFDWSLVASELFKRPYIVVGLIAFLLLLSLAITSIPALVRKMGIYWKVLHRWIYVATLLGCIHFYWSVKADITEPLIYFFILVILLLPRRKEVMKLGFRKPRPVRPS